MKIVSDTSIRSTLRSILTHRRLELTTLDLGSFRGIVRLRGELRRIGGSNDVTAETLETLEHEILQTRGVRRVHMHFSNWSKREDSGEWVELARSARVQETAESPEVVDEEDLYDAA